MHKWLDMDESGADLCQRHPEDLASWLARIPKVELHLHLEGAIPFDAMWELIQKYGGDPSVPSPGALAERFQFRDFAHFIQVWIWKNQFLREYEDFTYISKAFARQLERQNIRYAEVFFSPVTFEDDGLEIPRLFEAIRAGLSSVPEVEVALIPDLVRDYGPKRALKTLREINEVRDQGIIGVGLGGSEHKFPPDRFKKAYKEARKLEFRTTAHAGEAAGSKGIWGAIRKLGVDRIGHGTRAGEDESLVDYLVEKQIPLEMCPLSNVSTRVVDAIESHPIRRYFDRGVLVTVNTDDPMMFRNSLAAEYQALTEAHKFTRDDIHTLVLNGIQASWLSPERKRTLLGDFSAQLT